MVAVLIFTVSTFHYLSYWNPAICEILAAGERESMARLIGDPRNIG